jgi:hypothetical protein
VYSVNRKTLLGQPLAEIFINKKKSSEDIDKRYKNAKMLMRCHTKDPVVPTITVVIDTVPYGVLVVGSS